MKSVGVNDLSIDLNTPKLITTILDELPFGDSERLSLHNMLDRKDEPGVRILACNYA